MRSDRDILHYAFGDRAAMCPGYQLQMNRPLDYEEHKGVMN